MVNGKYEVVGVIPIGDAYLLVNDRNINTVAKAAGKKIAVLDYDEAQKIMASMLISARVRETSQLRIEIAMSHRCPRTSLFSCQ